jgi:hypothetical protein
MSVKILTNTRTGAKTIVDNTTTPATITANATAAQVAAYEPCPTRIPDKEKVCVTPTANAVGGVATDPTLVISGWLNSVTEIKASGVSTVIGSKLYDSTLTTDITATHAIVECPAADSFVDVAVCAV